MSERVRAHIRGKVQGVGYRASTAARARELGLCGWVRNRNDGSVELCAEGERAELDALLDWCRKGPAFARVDAIDLQWAAAEGNFVGFEIRR
jgi:acylphosphatase